MMRTLNRTKIRKQKRLQEKIVLAILVIGIFLGYCYVSNSDYEVMKLECEAGIRQCNP